MKVSEKEIEQANPELFGKQFCRHGKLTIRGYTEPHGGCELEHPQVLQLRRDLEEAQRERDEAREERDEAGQSLFRQAETIAGLRTQLTEAREDVARLDWLEKEVAGGNAWFWDYGGEKAWFNSQPGRLYGDKNAPRSARAAIDAARASAAGEES